MTDIVSRPYHPDASQCCAGCVFGGQHEHWCPTWKQPRSFAAIAEEMDAWILNYFEPDRSYRRNYDRAFRLP